ncbi:hypothetical protein [[Phormidium] sp. ETS-05]|uniref:hypothetical protein n=1 Tax=[Phormidium] sp. ETS-05 TaxID=222819 RepID=UPI0018EEE522|nr:hypothetical protein [[Phormidium] sp. ETS-05]
MIYPLFVIGSGFLRDFPHHQPDKGFETWFLLQLLREMAVSGCFPYPEDGQMGRWAGWEVWSGIFQTILPIPHLPSLPYLPALNRIG